MQNNKIKTWSNIVFVLLLILPVVSIVVKSVTQVELNLVVLDITYLSFLLGLSVLTYTCWFVATKLRAKRSCNFGTEFKIIHTQAFKIAKFVASFATFVWSLQAFSGGISFNKSFNDVVFGGLFYKLSVEACLLYGVLLAVVAIEFVVATFVVLSSIKVQPHQIYKVPKKLYVGSAIVAVCFAIFAFCIKTTVDLDNYWYGEVYFLGFYLFYFLIFYYLGRKKGCNHDTALVNALWFVPLINIVMSLTFAIPNTNFWINGFSWVLLSCGNIVSFGLYYMIRQHKRRAYLFRANDSINVQYLNKKIYLLSSIFCILSYLTVSVVFATKLYFNLEFAPYVVVDLIFIIGVPLIYLTIVVYYYFRFLASVTKLLILAFGALHFAIVGFMLGLILFASPKEINGVPTDYQDVDFWQLYFAYVLLIVLNSLGLLIRWYFKNRFKKKTKKLDIFE